MTGKIFDFWKWPFRQWLVDNRTAFQTALLMVVTLTVYWPSYRAGFIWDDDAMTIANPLVTGGLSGLRDIWFSTKFHDYVPLTLSSFWGEWRLWGLHKAGYHTVNILLHALNVVLLWRVLFRLRLSSAWPAAMLFAVHPVCVASVTWVAERKNTLSMLFYLTSCLLYLRSDAAIRPPAATSVPEAGNERPPQGPRSSSPRGGGTPGFGLYCFALVAFILGLLSKTSIVILPVVLLLCAWGRRGRISRRDVTRAVPFFLAAFICGLMTIGYHRYRAPMEGFTPTTDSLLVRTLGATRAIWFYLGKAVLPVNQTMHYPRWRIDPASPFSYLPGAAIVGFFVLFWRFRHSWGRACLFGLGYFIIALSPTLGLIKMVFLSLSQVADHFEYLALPGLTTLVAGGCNRAWQHMTNPVGARPNQRLPILCPRHARPSLPIFTAAILGALAIMTWRYEGIVGSPEALWRDNIRKNPDSWPAHNNLGKILAEQGNYKEAGDECVAALAIDPGAPDVYYNLGNAFLAQKNFDQAIRAFKAAIELAPTDSKAHNNLGNALFELHQLDEARRYVHKAVDLDPKNLEAHSNLAHILMEQGKNQEAIVQYREVLRLQPDNPTAQNNLGHLLAATGKFAEALPYFTRAVRLQADSAAAWANLGNVQLQLGDPDQSLRSYSKAVRLDPENVRAQTGLGNTLAKIGKTGEAQAHYTLAHYFYARQFSNEGKIEEAIQQYSQALQFRSDFDAAHDELALLLLQQHRPAEALDHWRQALKSQTNSPTLLNNVAWLLATGPDDKLRNGAEAVHLAERACALLKQKSVSYLDTLAASYAEAGRFKDAARAGQEALDLAEQTGPKETAERLRQRLTLYQSGRPYHADR